MSRKKKDSPPIPETISQTDDSAEIEFDGKLTNFTKYAAQRDSKGALFGSIHDAFFHFFMRQLWFAIQFFTVFAGKWAEGLDFQRLKIVASDFYDKSLRKSVADLVYEVPYKEPGRAPVNISVIVEHKAQDDVKSQEQMFLNIFRYIVAETEARVKAKSTSKSRANKSTPTPQAIAVVVYTGDNPNFELKSWQEIFKLPDPLRQFAIHCKIPCVNLTQLYANGSLDKIQDYPFIQTVCSLMACAGLRIIHKIRSRMFSALKGLRLRDFKFFDTVFVCLQYAAKACFNIGQEFTDEDRAISLDSFGNQNTKEKVMTIFEKEWFDAENRGIKKGMEEGIKEGIKEGKKEGKKEELHKWLSRRYPVHPKTLDSQIDKLESIDQVEKTFEMVVESSPIEDIIEYVGKFLEVKPTKKRSKRLVAA